ncbi:hypothetical protein ACFL5E_02500 [Candidatus Omnitrophota bacterium]
MRRRIFVVLVLFMLFSMPIWQFYLHLDRLGQVGDSSSPSTWSETYNIGFPATYMSISHTRVVDKAEPRDKPNRGGYYSDIVSFDRFYPIGFINLLLFILAIGGYILIDKKQVRLPPIVNSGFIWFRLYILAVFLFGVDTISVSIALFKMDPNSSFLRTWCNIVYDGSALGRALVFPLPTVTRNYLDITSNLHMKIHFACGLIFWFIFGMVLYKLFHFVKAKVKKQFS